MACGQPPQNCGGGIGQVEGVPQGLMAVSPFPAGTPDPGTEGHGGNHEAGPQGAAVDGVPQSLGVARPRPPLGVGSVGGVFAGFGLDGSGPVVLLRSGAEEPTARGKDGVCWAPAPLLPRLKLLSIASLRWIVGV
mmetsp:Transcript_65078/g.190394  ORF Transcript_65078/g.190394 Transcript_65078/m.190394 type:complete len:135 (-) Transcript_65078:1100-1504(-)